MAKVGMPMMKSSLSPNKSAKSKTCPVSKAWREMNDNREGVDKDIDHSKTCENEWVKGYSKMDVERICRSIIDDIDKKRAPGERKLREDTVCLIFGVIKPPESFMDKLTKEEQEQFLKDALNEIEKLLPCRIVNGKKISSVIAAVIHNDEGNPHLHFCFVPWHFDVEKNRWTLNAKKEFNLKFFNKVNKNMPQQLRDLGWKDIEDCNLFEVKREDPEYEKKLQEHKKNRKKGGLSSTEYKKRMDAEIMEKDKQLSDLEKRNKKAKKGNKKLKQRENKINAQIAQKQAEIEDLDEIISQKEEYNKKLDQVTKEKRAEYVTLVQKAQNLIESIKPIKRLVQIIAAFREFGLFNFIRNGLDRGLNQVADDGFYGLDRESDAVQGCFELDNIIENGLDLDLEELENSIKSVESLQDIER